MSDPFERELRSLLDDRARGNPHTAEALLDGIADLPARRRSSPGIASVLAIAAAVGILAVGLAFVLPRLAIVGDHPTPSVPVETPVESSGQPSAEPTATPAPTPTPFPVAVAADLIQCSVEGLPYGEWWADIRDDSSSAEIALNVLADRIAGWQLAFPTEGYVVRSTTAEQVVYVVPNEGADTVAVVIRFVFTRWAVVDVASCDPSEWPPGTPNGALIRTWVDVEGAVLPTSRLLERNDCYQGEYIILDGQMFVRDVTGLAYDPGQLRTTYLADTTLPTEAIDTGLREGERALYLAPDGSSAYVATPSTVERMPRVIGDEYGRTDCN